MTKVKTIIDLCDLSPVKVRITLFFLFLDDNLSEMECISLKVPEVFVISQNCIKFEWCIHTFLSFHGFAMVIERLSVSH